MAKSNIWIDGAQAGATLRTLQKEVNKLNREIKDLPRNSEEYRKKAAKLKEANDAISDHKKQVRGIASAFDDAKKSIKAMLAQFAPMALAFSAMNAAVNALVGGIASGVRGIIEFDKALADLQAVTASNDTQMEFFEKKSLEFSSRFGKSAADIATAFKLAGSARPELLKNGQAMADLTEKAIILSQASGDDVPTSIANLTATLNAFDQPASKAGETMDILANAAQLGVQEIPYLTEAFGKFGGVADKAKVSIATSAAALEILGKKIKEPSTAGTNMRGILIKMQVAAAESGRQFAGFTQELDMLGKKVNDVTYLKKVYGEENLLAIQTLIAERDEVKSLSEQYGVLGTAQKMADINSATLGEAINRLTATFQNQFVEMRGGASALTSAIDFLTRNMDTIITVVGKAIQWFIAWKTTMLAVKAVQFVVSGGLKDLAANFFKVSKAAADGTNDVKGMGGALKGVGWMAIAAVILEVGKAIWNAASGAAQLEENLRKAEAMKNIAGQKATKRSEERQKDISEQIAELDRKIAENTAKNGKNASKINEGLINQKKELLKLNIDQANSDIEAVEATKQSYIKRKKAIQKNLDDIKKKYGETTFEILRTQGKLDDDYYGAVSGSVGQGTSAASKQINWLIDQLGEMDAAIEGTNTKLGIYRGEADMVGETLKDLNSEQKISVSLSKQQQKELDAQKKAYEELRDRLQKLIQDSEELSNEVNYEERLASYEEGLNKELFILQNSIEKKYAAEIAEARRLMNEKGEIGIKAAEQYNLLLLLEDKDYENQKKILTDKYAKEKQESDYERMKTANLNAINQQVSLEDALMEIRVNRARAAVNAVAETDIEGKRRANEELKRILEEQLKLEEKRKIEAVLDAYDQDLIGAEELAARKLEIHQQYLDALGEMEKQSNDERSNFDQERLDKLAKATQFTFDQLEKLNKVHSNRDLSQNTAKYNKEKQQLDDKLEHQEISQEEYDKRKKALDEANDKRVAELNYKAAKRDRELALFRITVETAIAVAKALASAAPPANFIAAAAAGIQGAAQFALVQSEPLPQMVDGGFTNVIGAQDGKKYRAKYAGRMFGGMTPRNPSLVLVSEKGPEYFVPHHLMKNQVVANHVAAIEAFRTNQFAGGGYTSAPGSPDDMDIMSVLRANIAVMQALNDKIPNMGVNIKQKQLDDIQRETGKMNRNRA